MKCTTKKKMGSLDLARKKIFSVRFTYNIFWNNFGRIYSVIKARIEFFFVCGRVFLSWGVEWQDGSKCILFVVLFCVLLQKHEVGGC